MADFAAAAAESGFTHWGFSPHSPVPIASPCNMAFGDVDAYLAEVRRLNLLYEGHLKLYAAMEVDYLGPDWGPATPYFDALPLDYIIGSVHFIPTKSGELIDVDGSVVSFIEKMKVKFDNDIRYVVECFYRQSMYMVERGGLDIIGHFDKIGHNASHFRPGIEEESWYNDCVDALIDMLIEKRLPIEINTKARKDHGRFFPHQRYWKRLVNARVPIVVNSDAHHIHLIDASRHEAIDLLRDVKG